MFFCERTQVSSAVGRGCYTEEDKERTGKVTFRLAADWSDRVDVRDKSISTRALLLWFLLRHVCMQPNRSFALERMTQEYTRWKLSTLSCFVGSAHTHTHTVTPCPDSVRALVLVPLFR